MKMYSELCCENNRSVQLGWQSTGIFIGAFALFSFVEKGTISLDIAITLMILLATWAIVQLLNSNYWYNRNLVMIANIEKQFLQTSDLRDIHYYFGKHRKSNSILDDLRIQMTLFIAIVILIISYHFIIRVLPGIRNPEAYTFEFVGLLPYISLLFLVLYSLIERKKFIDKYKEFISNSPGKEIDTDGINYGIGHPTE